MVPAGEPGRGVRIIGDGRAGGALARALTLVGWDVAEVLGRGADLSVAGDGVDIVVIATPDGTIAEIAGGVTPGSFALGHLAGSLGLDVLAPHRRRFAVHPLISLPTPEVGARRLLANGWFAVAGDPVAGVIVGALGGRSFAVADADRARYHATACVAANHLVALLGQVERLAGSLGVPFEAYTDLARGSLDSVIELGAAGALTGPAARGDRATIERHRRALPPDELATYDALVVEAERLARGSRRNDR